MSIKLTQTEFLGKSSAGAAAMTSNHAISTVVYIRSGESAAIAGINSSDTGTDFNKDDPAPGNFAQGTSPLFSLLRSKNYRKKKSQFVIFVTPQLIESASDGSEDLKRNFRIRAQ